MISPHPTPASLVTKNLLHSLVFVQINISFGMLTFPKGSRVYVSVLWLFWSVSCFSLNFSNTSYMTRNCAQQACRESSSCRINCLAKLSWAVWFKGIIQRSPS